MYNPGVGENLQDQLMMGVNFEVADGVITGDSLVRWSLGVHQLFMHICQEHDAGFLASAGSTLMRCRPSRKAQVRSSPFQYNETSAFTLLRLSNNQSPHRDMLHIPVG